MFGEFARIWLLLLLVFIASCASPPAGFDDAVAVSNEVAFVLKEGTLVVAGSKPIYLAKGDYRRVRSGAGGALFVGPAHGVIRQTSRGFLGYTGGAWVPTDPIAPVKIVMFEGQGERLYSSLATALSVPEEAELKMRDAETPDDTRTPEQRMQSCMGGAGAGNVTVSLICAAAEQQRVVPDVIGELSRRDFERFLSSSAVTPY